MVNTRGIAVVTGLDYIGNDDVRLYFTYHAFANTDVSLNGFIEVDHTINSLSLKSDLRSFIINEYTSRSLTWNTLLDDFVLVGGIL